MKAQIETVVRFLLVAIINYMVYMLGFTTVSGIVSIIILIYAMYCMLDKVMSYYGDK